LFFFPPTATVRKFDAIQRSQLTDFGKYVAECLVKYVQKVQLTAGDELEILIAPEGVIPVLQFLKDHHNAQFTNLVDIAGMDVPSRQYRFEVQKISEVRSDKLVPYLAYCD
jgi:NADH dehydrogenase (ubiquinone) Fe-S protein 3